MEDVEGSRLLSRSADIKGKYMHLTFMVNFVGEKKTTFRSSSNPQNTNQMIVSALNLSGELKKELEKKISAPCIDFGI